MSNIHIEKSTFWCFPLKAHLQCVKLGATFKNVNAQFHLQTQCDMKLQHESKPPHKKPYSLYLKHSFSILAGNSCEAARAYPLKCAEAPTPGWWAWSSLPAQPGSPCHLQQANGAVRRRKEWTCTLWRGVCVLSHHPLSSWWSTRLPFWNAGLRLSGTLQEHLTVKYL